MNKHRISPDFEIIKRGRVSDVFTGLDIRSFMQAASYIQTLPYRRNEDKNDLKTVLSDQYGTCSTKHALLKSLADEQGFEDIHLTLCMFKMSPGNTPKVKKVLDDHKLEYLPEAHNYLKYDGHILDFTGPGFDPETYGPDILEEIRIMPGQITDFKVDFHKNYLEKWLRANPNIHLTHSELWKVREQCILALFTD